MALWMTCSLQEDLNAITFFYVYISLWNPTEKVVTAMQIPRSIKIRVAGVFMIGFMIGIIEYIIILLGHLSYQELF